MTETHPEGRQYVSGGDGDRPRERERVEASRNKLRDSSPVIGGRYRLVQALNKLSRATGRITAPKYMRFSMHAWARVAVYPS